MGYVDKNLMSGEQVLYKADVHWFVFVPGSLLIVFGLLMSDGEGGGLGAFFILIGVISLIRAVILKLNTELAVTSKRIIAKGGFIKRDAVELNHSKVEGLNVSQGVIGRALNFGTIVVNGTGGGRTGIRNISLPLEFRRRAMETVDAIQSQKN